MYRCLREIDRICFQCGSGGEVSLGCGSLEQSQEAETSGHQGPAWPREAAGGVQQMSNCWGGWVGTLWESGCEFHSQQGALGRLWAAQTPGGGRAGSRCSAWGLGWRVGSEPGRAAGVGRGAWVGAWLAPGGIVAGVQLLRLCLTLCDPMDLQHSRLPCPSLSPGVCSVLHPLSL